MGSPIVRFSLYSPVSPSVFAHSIIGVPSILDPLHRRSVEESTDGFVTYESAHLDNVESECLIDARHTSILNHDATIIEVKRILLEHLRQ